MKYIVFGLLVLSQVISLTTWAQEEASSELTKILNQRTLGIDPAYGQALSPSQSLETEKSKFERIQSSNATILSEVDAVTAAFTRSAPADVVKNVYATVSNYDQDIKENNGHILFLGSNPSAAQSRNIFLIPKAKINADKPAAAVMDVLSSYKRSAKASDFIYLYQEPFNLTLGSIIAYEGSDTSWLKPEAPDAFNNGQDYVLKKCRKLLGWRCISSLYRTDTLVSGKDVTRILFIAIYDLENNRDNDYFDGDKRTKNQITGSTAVYIVKETADWVMIYGTDHQYNNDKTTFQDSIQKEFSKDIDRFKQRLSADLGIAVKDIK